ncbi:MAG TPA: sn-glycerol-3-phosphate ABC transporter ATP-binding protein UgpC [Verrucomicrobiae bacterium]|nr:sn-glycerol-3-phosphate ABC transporter ATP-binding protein UgpC [Verrucomicrobiae bacterium]
MTSVVVENLTKEFKGGKGETVCAVNRANLSVAEGEFLVLVGPSGCGKSTTLRLIAGLEEPTSGTISIAGRTVNSVPPSERDIAMVFQNFALYPHMSVHENMAFGLKLRKVPREEIQARVKHAAELLGLQDCLGRKPGELSGGQKQRVSVGRAMVRQPKVFLFDEPLSNLDAQLRVQMRREIAALHARLRTTMIYVTHDQVEAMTLGNRIAVMKDGIVQQVASPMELYHCPANLFVAGFIGSPAMNFFQGTITRNGKGILFNAECGARNKESKERAGFQLHVGEAVTPKLIQFEGKKVVLGLRPEHITENAGAKNGESRQTLEAVAEVIEPLGSETYLYAASAGNSFVARVAGEHRLHIGQDISLAFDMSRAHFFDAVTERAIN